MKSEDSSHQPLLHIRHLSVVRGSATVLHDINLTIHHGEKWAVLGNSGSGKTTVAFALAGRLPYQGDIQWFLPPQNKQDHPVFLVEQQHRFKNISTEGELYYQQRYHSVDANDAMTAATLLENEDRTFTPQQKRWLKLLRLNPLLTRPLIQLSNGEQKRLQLAHALFALQSFFWITRFSDWIPMDAHYSKQSCTIFAAKGFI
jgi:molybdate transport system ATP-binding protein